MKKSYLFTLFIILIVVPIIIININKVDNEEKSYVSEETSDSLPEFGNPGLEEAITDYLTTQRDFSWQITPGSKNFCVINNLDPDKELFPLYVWARCSEFIIRDGKLKELSGSSVPVKINYPNELSFYDLDRFSYEKARDGSYYSEDIKDIFSNEAQKNISNIQNKKITTLNNELKLKALKWFSSDNITGTDNLWERAKLYLKNCEVEKVSQYHNQRVILELKNGEKFEVFEPSIDSVIDTAHNPKIIEECGRIPISTE
jgi:hypothetical protein